MIMYKTRSERFFTKDNRLIKSSRTVYDGYRYDSAFEAGVAQELDLRKKAGDIKDWERQFKVEMWAHLPDGTPAMKKCHKVDFRIHNHDGSYTLLEAKGWETPDYQERRRWLDNLWLPIHLDHDYQVVHQQKRRPMRRKR